MSEVLFICGTLHLHKGFTEEINPLNVELNPICHLLALLGTHHILHVSRIRVK
jgi:transposase